MKNSFAPVAASAVREVSAGVRCAMPLSRSAAASMSAAVMGSGRGVHARRIIAPIVARAARAAALNSWSAGSTPG